MISEILTNSLTQHREVFSTVETLFPELQDCHESIISTLDNGGKILIAGNGGSASDSQHFAAELIGKFELDRRPLKAISLNTDTSGITAIGNDYGYDFIFSRQMEALGSANDIFIAITTSGNSRNIINAITSSHQLGMKVMLLSGGSGGLAKDMLIPGKDHGLIVNSKRTARIQEVHIFILHLLCELIDFSVSLR
jgi:D-sedoheptulose 7-phosphate isomerase